MTNGNNRAYFCFFFSLLPLYYKKNINFAFTKRQQENDKQI